MAVAEIVDAAKLEPDEALVTSVHDILVELVRHGAAQGWVAPPDRDEVASLLASLCGQAAAADAGLRLARVDGRVVGFGYWRRYARPTHLPHADIEKVAVARGAQGHGIGRRLTEALVEDARAAGIEQLTLDVRADNANAIHLYRELGFTQYGLLRDFVAVGARRYDKVFFVRDLRP